MTQHLKSSKPRKPNKRYKKNRILQESYEDYKCYEVIKGQLTYIGDDEDETVKFTEIIPKNENQKLYRDYIRDNNINLVLSVGEAGTGKTFVAINESLREIFELNNFKKLIVTRPIVTVSNESLGYLKGNIDEKMGPYTTPITEIMDKYFNKEDIRYYLSQKIIEVLPLGFCRGRNFEDTIIIGDEFQNSTIDQMKTLLTRLGKNSKLILTGDLRQSDLKGENGLSNFLNLFKKYSIDNDIDSIKIIEFSKNDIVRSKIVNLILKIYDN
jgi:phosphate starvation-inducible PhoH-like protein